MDLGPQIGLWFVAMGLEAALAVRIWRRGLYRRYLAFSCYVWFCVTRSVLLFTLLRVSAPAYKVAYWDLRIAAIMLVAWVVAELGAARWWFWASLAGGAGVAILQALEFSNSRNQEFDLAVSIALLVLLGRKCDRIQTGITLGMVVCTLLPALVATETLYLAGPFRETFRYVSTVSFIAAAVTWLWATRSEPRRALVSHRAAA